jgi:hypothetical protein
MLQTIRRRRGSLVYAASNTQVGLPAMSFGEAELRAGTSCAMEVMYVKNLISDMLIEVEGVPKLWMDSKAAIGTAKRLGPGKMRHVQARELLLQEMVQEKMIDVEKDPKLKHLQAAELYLQEKVRTKELEVLKCSTTWNPADVLTKYVSEELMKKYLGLMGMVLWNDRETVSACVDETKIGGRFGTNTIRTWFKRTMVMGMMGMVKADDTCRTGDCDVQVYPKSNLLKANTPDSMMWLYAMLFLMMLCILMGCVGGWRLRGWWSGLGAPKKVRSMMVQAQTRYAYDRVEPRFVPLGEREHGAWHGGWGSTEL